MLIQEHVQEALYPERANNFSSRGRLCEQDPQAWYTAACDAIKDALHESSAKPEDIKAIGIAYQMHGLVCVDSNHNVLRPAIIWCDSRAVSYGENAFSSIGKGRMLKQDDEFPGNFTA